MKARHLITAVCGTILKVAFAVVVVMLIYKGAIMAYDYGYRIFAEQPMTTGSGRTVTVTITEDMTPQQMGELLVSRGLIRDARLFTIQYYVSEFRKDVVPGEYELSTAMTPEEMLEVMATHPEEAASQDGNSEPAAGSMGAAQSGAASGDGTQEGTAGAGGN